MILWMHLCRTSKDRGVPLAKYDPAQYQFTTICDTDHKGCCQEERYVKAHPGKGTMSDQLSAYLIDSSNQIDRGHIDFFQINEYH